MTSTVRTYVYASISASAKVITNAVTECAPGVLAAGKRSCLQSPCLNGGSCRQKGDSFLCDCSSTYLGLSCEALRKSVVSCDVNEGIPVLLQTVPSRRLSCESGIWNNETLL